MAECRIMKCTCFHKYQDEKYGEKMRVFNPMADAQKYRCTVCGSIKGESGMEKKK